MTVPIPTILYGQSMAKNLWLPPSHRVWIKKNRSYKKYSIVTVEIGPVIVYINSNNIIFKYNCEIKAQISF